MDDLKLAKLPGGVGVVDNFLSINDFLEIKNVVTSSDFPWYYNEEKVDGSLNSLFNYQFTHTFYLDSSPRSGFFSLLQPLLQKLDPISLIKIKANMTMASDKIYVYGYHTDVRSGVGCKTAVFYINSNDGYTLFEEGGGVRSVENRLVVFNSDIKHTGSSSTDSKFRCVINLNYF